MLHHAHNRAEPGYLSGSQNPPLSAQLGNQIR
jgi:hypothetical protein